MGFSLKNLFDPGSLIFDAIGGKTAEYYNWIADPNDTFDVRKKRGQQEQEELARSTAQARIDALGQQYATQQGLQTPFLGLGTQGLSQLGQYERGQNFDSMLNQGARQLRGSANASGLGNSSAAGRNMAQFVGNLTQEDMNRQYQQQLRNIQTGQQAVGVMGEAAAGLGSGVSSIYGDWGKQAAQSATDYGQAQAQSFNNLGQAAMGAGQYFGSK